MTQKALSTMEMMEVPDAEVSDGESPENPAEFDLTFREMVRESQEVGPTQVLFDCEWKQCRMEFATEEHHQAHIEDHINEIRGQNLDGKSG